MQATPSAELTPYLIEEPHAPFRTQGRPSPCQRLPLHFMHSSTVKKAAVSTSRVGKKAGAETLDAYPPQRKCPRVGRLDTARVGCRPTGECQRPTSFPNAVDCTDPLPGPLHSQVRGTQFIEFGLRDSILTPPLSHPYAKPVSDKKEVHVLGSRNFL